MSMMTHLSGFALPVAAVGLMAAISAQDGQAHSARTDLPLRCGVTVEHGLFGQTYRGVLEADAALRGSFELRFTSRGASSATIQQSGDFTAARGETLTLGQAGFGRRAKVEAKLTLHVDGQALSCATETPVEI